MKLFFFLLWGFVLLAFQLVLRTHPFGIPVGAGFMTLLVIYAAFTAPFITGMFATIILSWFSGILSGIPPEFIALTHLILFVVIQLFVSRIYSESYVTKSLWIFLFTFAGQFLRSLILDPSGEWAGISSFWGQATLQSVVDALISFPLFVILDQTGEYWRRITSRRQAQLTGADFFAVKSRHRRFIP